MNAVAENGDPFTDIKRSQAKVINHLNMENDWSG